LEEGFLFHEIFQEIEGNEASAEGEEGFAAHNLPDQAVRI
jgi:hypothetical protein